MALIKNPYKECAKASDQEGYDYCPAPSLYFPICQKPNSLTNRIGDFDSSTPFFPENFNEVFQRETTYQEAIEQTSFPPSCPEFIQHLRAASYILLFSGEIDEKVLNRVLHELDDSLRGFGATSKSLFIVSGNNTLRQYLRGEKMPNVSERVSVKFANNLQHFKKIHDRFAILNNHIWHFGVGIGGMHKSFHAISGPWLDTNNAFKKFCEQLFFR